MAVFARLRHFGQGIGAAKALDQALLEIEARYGMPTADFVAMQLEYPRLRAPH
jgi:hypothetical protein